MSTWENNDRGKVDSYSHKLLDSPLSSVIVGQIISVSYHHDLSGLSL